MIVNASDDRFGRDCFGLFITSAGALRQREISFTNFGQGRYAVEFIEADACGEEIAFKSFQNTMLRIKSTVSKE